MIFATDRYGGGIPFNGCNGQCEGTGFVPIHSSEKKQPWRGLWLAAEKKLHARDGWHFVVCPDCKGGAQ